MNEIKDCPFCGGKAKMTGGWNQASRFIQCTVCLTAGATGDVWNKDKLIAAWNRRVPLECESIDPDDAIRRRVG